MFFIIVLIVLGVLFLVAELVLITGSAIGGILSLVCYGSAIYMAFRDYGTVVGIVVVGVVVVVWLVSTVLSLRAKTWQRLSLTQEIESSSMRKPEDKLKVGDCGTTVSRLSPMGRIEIGGECFEAKSIDAYIDPKSEVEVVGFENFTVIVKKISNKK